MLDPHILLTGVIIFVARICDVCIVTIRTIVTVQGRTFISFTLAIFDNLHLGDRCQCGGQPDQRPAAVSRFYAFGGATGNVVGIMVARNLAFRTMRLRIINRTAAPEIAAHVREKGQSVTLFHGEGLRRPVHHEHAGIRGNPGKMIKSRRETKPSGGFWFYSAVCPICSWNVALSTALIFTAKGNKPCEPLI